MAQTVQALGAGCGVVVIVPGAKDITKELTAAGAPVVALDGTVPTEMLRDVDGIAVVAAAGKSDWTRELRIALSQGDGRNHTARNGNRGP